MSSFDKVNYSLRPNKAIERALVFKGLKLLLDSLAISDAVFVGMGSVWFTDFYIAHRFLGIQDMVSFEDKPIGFARAKFNAPFRTVKVINKLSTDGIIKIKSLSEYSTRPWVVWLDYDFELNEVAAEDVRRLIENAPPNSIVIITFDCKESRYGAIDDRLPYLKGVLGDVVPDQATDKQLTDKLPETLVQLADDFFVSAAAKAGRPGGFRSAFKMIYTDSTTMATAGGVLTTPGAVPIVKAITSSKSWPGIVGKRIETPHLTIKEMLSLQKELPREQNLNRKAVQALGFDLLDKQVVSFCRFYLHYPAFAQIVV